MPDDTDRRVPGEFSGTLSLGDIERAIDSLAVAAYTCAADGSITRFNGAAAAMWGRVPALRHPADRFCGAARLSTLDGSPLPHDRTCMAQTLRLGCGYADQPLVVERPDGRTIRAHAHSMPVHGAAGELVGSVNLLVESAPPGAAPPLPGASWTDAALSAVGAQSRKGYFLADERADRILFANSRFFSIWDIERLEAGARDGSITSGEIDRHLDERTRENAEGELRLVDGRVLSVASTEVRDARGGYVGRLQRFEDVAETRRVETELRSARRRYETLVDTVEGIVWEADVDTWRFTFVSEFAERLLGYPRAEWYRDPSFWTAHIHPDDRERAVAFCIEATRQRAHHDFEYRMIAADGTVVWLRDIVRVVAPDGEPVKLVGLMIDITDRRRAEAALGESEAFLRLSQRAGRSGSWEWELASNRVRWSEEMCRIHGITAPEFAGTLHAATAPVHPDDRPKLEHGIERLLRTDVFTDMEYRITRPGGEVRVVWGSGEIQFDEGGRAFAVIGTVTDITERKRAEEERRALETQFRHAQKLESLGVLAGGIAHDFNNLLTAILGYASLALADAPSGSTIEPQIRKVLEAAERASDLTNQMLAYSGRGRFVVETAHLDAIVADMAALLNLVVSKKAHLRLDLHPAAIDGDATQIRQVVMNLITNASDALGERDGIIALRTGSRRFEESELVSPHLPEKLPSAAYAFVEVADDGAGMSETTVQRIFDPFFTTKFTGRGLGLAAVLGIVRGHGGTIQVSTRPQGGTTFRVVLPLAAEAPRALGEEAPSRASARSHRDAVLLADDDEFARSFTLQVLERAGFDVVVATDGAEAIEKFRDRVGEIRAAILDVTMPRMDGWETLEQLRRLRPGLPALMMSGFTESDILDRAPQSAQAPFLHKPYRPADLVERVRSLVGIDRPGRP
ncbi:MAG: PAS domain-containing protein [Acidobacteria bacterium]|nr:PAS domain-containing protein [Acidobacteriota bacterium]